MGDDFDLEKIQKEYDEQQAGFDEQEAAIENKCPACEGDVRNHSQAQLSKCTSEAEAYGPEDAVKRFEKSSYYTGDTIFTMQAATLKVLLEIRDLLKKSKN